MHQIFAFESAESAPDEDDVDSEVQRSRLAEALSHLSESDRGAIQLFVVEDRPAAEVARTLGWANSKTVYNRVRRALAALRARMVELPGPVPPK
jgi:DNA-directed RNA polymerase specialized sigma subunit, sigma24 homolog